MADLALTEETARVFIAELAPEGWRFEWSTQKMTHGQCDHVKRVIVLSAARAEVDSEEQALDTILHEIAHANVGPGKGHGTEWKREARRLGADARATSRQTGPDPLRESAPWVGRCPNGHVSPYRYHRRPRTQRSCAVCLPGKFSSQFLMTYTREA